MLRPTGAPLRALLLLSIVLVPLLLLVLLLVLVTVIVNGTAFITGINIRIIILIGINGLQAWDEEAGELPQEGGMCRLYIYIYIYVYRYIYIYI